MANDGQVYHMDIRANNSQQDITTYFGVEIQGNQPRERDTLEDDSPMGMSDIGRGLQEMELLHWATIREARCSMAP